MSQRLALAGLLAASAFAAPQQYAKRDAAVVTDVEWSVTTVTVQAGGPTSHPVAAPVVNAAAQVPAHVKPVAPVAPVADVTSDKGASDDEDDSEDSDDVATDAGVKRGLLFDNLGLLSSFMSVPKNTFGWCANWVSSPHGIVPGGLEFVPQFKTMFAGVWQTELAAALASGSKYIMHLNEPDISSEENMSTSAAVASWHANMEPHAGQAKLISPAVSNSDTPGMGLDWLKQFLAECKECSIHACGFHWHSPADIDYFKKKVLEAHEACPGKPIWVSEFSADDTVENQAAFLKEAIPFLESQDYVERYAYFQASNLVSGNALNIAGQAYSAAV